jgi:hypothetical protein
MSDHNTDAVFSPRAKPVGMIPTFARYQAINGLKPKGPHISLDNSLLKNITCKCPTCHGLGETYRTTLDELQALRQQVLGRYPDAAPPDGRPGHPISCPVQEMATSLMVDAVRGHVTTLCKGN